MTRTGSSRPLLEYRGAGRSAIRGLLLGTAGLLVLVDEGLPEGEAVLELRYRPAFEHPFRIGHEPSVRDAADARGHAVMAKAGCFSCHSLHRQRQVGPSLDRKSLVPRLEERLASQAYRDRIAELDALVDSDLARWRRARAEVLAAEGPERLRSWMRSHLAEPRFDNLQARMPSMGLQPDEIEAVTRFLLGADPE